MTTMFEGANATNPLVLACCGMKRSGSTLQFNLLQKLLQAAGVEFANLRYVSGDALADRLDAARGAASVIAVKCHDIQKVASIDGYRIFVLYTVRDPRDAYVSAKKKFGVDQSDLGRLMAQYVEGFRIATSSKHALVQRYEEMNGKEAHAIEQIATFLQIPIAREQASEIADRISLVNWQPTKTAIIYTRIRDRLRQVNRSSRLAGLLLSPLKLVNSLFKWFWLQYSNSQLHIDHVSNTKGKSGVWMTELSDLEQKAFALEHRDVLVELGYTPFDREPAANPLRGHLR